MHALRERREREREHGFAMKKLYMLLCRACLEMGNGFIYMLHASMAFESGRCLLMSFLPARLNGRCVREQL